MFLFFIVVELDWVVMVVEVQVSSLFSFSSKNTFKRIFLPHLLSICKVYHQVVFFVQPMQVFQMLVVLVVRGGTRAFSPWNRLSMGQTTPNRLHK